MELAQTAEVARFGRLLADIRPIIGGDWTHLSSLGTVLHRAHPDFVATDYGAAKLLDLLVQCKDLGEVRWDERDGGHPQFRFHPSKDGPEIAGRGLRVRQEIWRAVTDFSPPPDGWQFDLESQSVAPAGDPGQSEEPERFLDLPSADMHFQQGIVRSFVGERTPERSADLETLLQRPDWHRRLSEFLGADNEELTTHRHETIVSIVVEWADRHGISRSAVVMPANRAGSRSRAGPTDHLGLTPATTADGTRRALHALIDLLSDHEVAMFPIPAWCLARLGLDRPRR